MAIFFLKLLLHGGLIFFSATALYTEETYDLVDKDHLPDYIKPEHYEIILRIRINKNIEEDETKKKINFLGQCHINVKIDRPTWNISFHAQRPHIEVRNVRLYEINSTDFNETQKWIYDDAKHILNCYFDNEISPNHYVLHIIFYCLASDNEENFFISYINKGEHKQRLIATQLQTIGARRIFPCWDSLLFKATFTIAVKQSFNTSYNILSNMMIHYTYSDIDGTMVTVFKQTPVIPTYFIGFMVSDLKTFLKYDNIWCRPQLSLEMDFASKVIEIVKRYLQFEWVGHPNLKIDYVAIPALRHDSVNNLGLIFHREGDIVYNEEIDFIMHKIEVVRLIAREMTHQYFGNMSIPSSWSYLWLKKGITTLLGMKAVNKLFPNFRIMDLFVVQMQQESLRLDTVDSIIMKPLLSEVNISNIDSLLSFSYYIKAPAILRMLQHVITDKVFRNGIKMYFKKNVANLQDFWTVMHKAIKNSDQLQLNLTKTIGQWIWNTHYPVLNVSRHNTDKKRILLLQPNVHMMNHIKWWIPLTYTTQKSLYFNNTNIENAGMDLPLYPFYYSIYVDDADGWIIFNLQQIGYYRVYYELDNWLKIADYLNKHSYTDVHVLNRAQIIDDAYYFLMMDQLDLFTFLHLAQYLRHDTDYVAWYPMLKIFEDISGFFPFPQSAYIKDQIKTLLHRSFLNLQTYVERNDVKRNNLVESLRQEIVKWACLFNVSECIYAANTDLQWQLLRYKHVQTHKSWSIREEFTYCRALSQVNYKTWETMFHIYANTSDNKILKFLSCPNSPNIIHDYMDFIMSKSNYSIKELKKHIDIFHFIIAKHARKNQMLDYILKNIEKVHWFQSQIKPIVVFTSDIINHVYSRKNLQKISNFVNILLRHYKLRRLYKAIKLIKLIPSKIRIRLSEIVNHKRHFQYLTQK